MILLRYCNAIPVLFPCVSQGLCHYVATQQPLWPPSRVPSLRVGASRSTTTAGSCSPPRAIVACFLFSELSQYQRLESMPVHGITSATMVNLECYSKGENANLCSYLVCKWIPLGFVGENGQQDISELHAVLLQCCFPIGKEILREDKDVWALITMLNHSLALYTI